MSVMGEVFARVLNGRMKTMTKNSVKKVSEVVGGLNRALQQDR